MGHSQIHLTAFAHNWNFWGGGGVTIWTDEGPTFAGYGSAFISFLLFARSKKWAVTGSKPSLTIRRNPPRAGNRPGALFLRSFINHPGKGLSPILRHRACHGLFFMRAMQILLSTALFKHLVSQPLSVSEMCYGLTPAQCLTRWPASVQA